MKITIIVSEKDKAGLNIKSNLIQKFKKTSNLFDKYYIYNYKNSELLTIKEDILYFNSEKIESDLIIFASRHSSVNEIPCFSCHCTGNWNVAEYGGEDKQLSLCPSYLIREILIMLSNQNKVDFFQEISHHGPLTKQPSLFIEIGSTEKEWINQEYGKFISEIIIKIIDILSLFKSYSEFVKDYKLKNPLLKVGIALGGFHNMHNFKKLLNHNIVISHACPKYLLNHFDEKMFNESIKKTYENVDLFILDWKSLQNKDKIINIIEKNKKEWKKIKQII